MPLCRAGTHSPRPSSCAGWMEEMGGGDLCVCVCLCICSLAHFFFFLPLFAVVCVRVRVVAWPEGSHSNGHPTGRRSENDETVGRLAG